MKQTFFLFAIAMVFMAVECNDNNEQEFGNLTINFKGTFGSQPLVMFDETYAYQDNMELLFQLFQFYLSDIQLIKEDGQTQAVTPVELISFKEIISSGQAQEGVSYTYDNIPYGSYTGIQFGLGVSEELNATRPSDYTPPHPLDGNHWSAALGYVFLKVEGNANLDGDSSFEEKLTFHVGANDLYRTMTFNQAIEVDKDLNGNISLTVDLQKILADDSGNFVNFREVTQDHTGNPDIYEFMYNNLEGALSL